MKGDHNNKNNDVIDVEFVSEDSLKMKPSQQEELTDFETSQLMNYHNIKKEFNSEENQSNHFQSFSYSFGNYPKLNFKKPSIFIIILLIPFFLVVLMVLLMIGFLTFVIFLPKIFNVIRKNGISGLKMNYNLLRGLFGHFKMK